VRLLPISYGELAVHIKIRALQLIAKDERRRWGYSGRPDGRPACVAVLYDSLSNKESGIVQDYQFNH
jgi:hypothetical protein